MTNLISHPLPIIDIPVKIENLNYRNPYEYSEIHRHDYFELILFANGRGTHIIDFETHKICDQSLHVIGSNRAHLLKQKEYSTGIILQFTKEFLCYYQGLNLTLPISEILNLNPVLKLKEEDYSFFFNTLCQIANSLKSIGDTEYKRKIIFGFFLSFMFKAISLEPGWRNIDCQDTITVLNRFLLSVDKNFKTIRKVSDYKLILNITEKQLNKITNRYLGKNALCIIHERVLLEAKRLLTYTSMSVKEIAYHLNFDSQATFSHFIKNKTGKSPVDLNIHG